MCGYKKIHLDEMESIHGDLIPGYWGCAAGKAKSAAKTELEKIKMTEMTCAELIKEAAKIIYQVGELTSHNC